MEQWCDIEGFENLYQISNTGRVKSLERIVKVTGGNNNSCFIKEKILKPSVGKQGYLSVVLCKDGKVYGRLIHRLVAQAFIPNPDNLPCVNHKDENPQNNNVTNIEWCSYRYNNCYKGRIEKCRDKISKTLKGRKRTYILTDKQRENIRRGAIKGWETRRRNLLEQEERG